MPENIIQIPEPERGDEPRSAEIVARGPGAPTPARRAKMQRVRAARERARQKYRAAQLELRRARWQVRDSWYHLTNGLELNELWSQFKHEAHVSTRLYKQDAGLRDLPAERSWKQPFRVGAALFLAILAKLSPARRVFLLATLIVAVMAAMLVSKIAVFE